MSNQNDEANDGKPIVQIKLVMLGDAAVGKSSIIFRFARNRFVETLEPTLGASSITQNVCLSDVTVKFNIWDTAGQERYAALAPMYYRTAPCVLIVYDITNQQSFNRARDMVEEVRTNGNRNCLIAMVGNKLDLQDKREVSQQEVQDFVKSQELTWLETSAKSGEGITELFNTLAQKLSKIQTNDKKPAQAIDLEKVDKKLGFC